MMQHAASVGYLEGKGPCLSCSGVGNCRHLVVVASLRDSFFLLMMSKMAMESRTKEHRGFWAD